MVKFTETKTEDLIKRIENLKAERERTADCLERLEAELERRKQEVPLGVPLEVPMDCAISRAFLLCFQSKESADKFDNEYFTNFIKALQDIADGKPVDIKVLLPLLKKGWVAMDKDCDWFWYEEKPKHYENEDEWISADSFFCLSAFNIKPVENWEESLMECGL